MQSHTIKCPSTNFIFLVVYLATLLSPSGVHTYSLALDCIHSQNITFNIQYLMLFEQFNPLFRCLFFVNAIFLLLTRAFFLRRLQTLSNETSHLNGIHSSFVWIIILDCQRRIPRYFFHHSFLNVSTFQDFFAF